MNEAVQQLAFADSVIINKTDLVSEEELKTVKDKITSVNAFAKVVQAEKVSRNSWLPGGPVCVCVLCASWCPADQ